MMFARVIAALFAFGLAAASSAAEAPFLKTNDVIAFVGGEDMVAMSEYGYLEFLLTCALPAHKLHFRCLAWEGDTVFEQRRDLNYPTIEQQLEKIGATVVIAQFGQMESLAGKEKLPEFVSAYEKLLDRLSGKEKRRVVILASTPFEMTKSAPRDFSHIERIAYCHAAEALAKRRGAPFVDSFALATLFGVMPCASPDTPLREQPATTRDWVHLDADSLFILAQAIAERMAGRPRNVVETNNQKLTRQEEALRQLIIAKNKLWFNYARPQNWAFLAGDRTSQPSSRDYRDPSKRWFPEELERFLPLIESKDTEIWGFAASLAKQ